MLVTAIEKGKGSRWNVFVEGEFALSLDVETLLSSGLKAGQEVGPEALTELKTRTDTRRARERALYLLDTRSHTKKELTDKLAKTVEPDIAAQTADRMEELGLVNDEDYARRLAQSLAQYKGWGPGRIRQRLYEKGIAREISAQVLEELEESTDSHAAILAILQKKYRRYLADQKGVEKTIAALLRLGYRYGEIRAALSEAAQGIETEELPDFDGQD